MDSFADDARGQSGGLSEPTYANIVAYILQYNGVAAGTTR